MKLNKVTGLGEHFKVSLSVTQSHVFECVWHVRFCFVTLSVCLSVHPHIHTKSLWYAGCYFTSLEVYYYLFNILSFIHTISYTFLEEVSVSEGVLFLFLGNNKQLKNCFWKIW